MNNNATKVEVHKLALAIDPSPRGFGYALFEGPLVPLDWGVTDFRSEQNPKSLLRIKKLLDFYNPEILVLEDCSQEKNPRCQRIKILLDQIEEVARFKKIPIAKYSSQQIKEVFNFFDAQTKQQIAQKICESLPRFVSYLPPERKPWMSEDRQMNIFDAIALIITYYYLEE